MSDPVAFGPLRLQVDDLFQHLAVFGQTGSGKTRYVLLPLLKEILALHADNPDQRAGAIIFDVKGDMTAHVTRVMRAAGRTDELVIIGRGGNAWFDPFSQIESDCRRVAESLMEIVESAGPSAGRGDNEAFWRENLRRFIQVSAVLARATGSGRMGGVTGLAAAMEQLADLRGDSDDDSPAERVASRDDVLQLLDAQAERGLLDSKQASFARRYVDHEVKDLPDRTFATIANYAMSFISCLRDSDLAAIWGPGAGLSCRLVPEEILDSGRVVLVSLSRIHYGPMAGVFRGLIKAAFQEAALRRAATVRFDGTRCRPINQLRPVVFLADEFGSLVTPGSEDTGDAFFLDKARETRVACLLGMQGVSALNARFFNSSRSTHLLNNTVTKVFLATDCPETLGFFEQSVPRTPPADASTTWIPLPGYRSGPRVGRVGFGWPKFGAGDLRALRTGEGIVLRPRGFAERAQFARLDDE